MRTGDVAKEPERGKGVSYRAWGRITFSICFSPPVLFRLFLLPKDQPTYQMLPITDLKGSLAKESEAFLSLQVVMTPTLLCARLQQIIIYTEIAFSSISPLLMMVGDGIEPSSRLAFCH